MNTPEDYVGPYPFYDGHVRQRMRRASGDCVCDCGKLYRRHPLNQDFLPPFLHQLCDGSLVKL